MAYLDKDEGFPICWSGLLPGDLLCGLPMEVLGQLVGGEPEALEEESYGFIIEGWFGPFLLSPQSRVLRGRC